VHEIVIVISDLFLAADDVDSAAKAGRVLPGLEQLARFGQASAAQDGWRPWLAHWLGRDDLAKAAPAAIAASVSADGGSSAWFATPVHLLASLTSLHLDYRGLLRLPPGELQRLAQDFASVFGDSGFYLQPTGSGLFILRSRSAIDARTTEPARAVAGELRAFQPVGADAGVLKRLNGELEMWLHSHPINDERARRGELPLSTLWLWGGGQPLQRQGDAASVSSSNVIFASDPYAVGLCHLMDIACRPVPERLPDLSGFPGAQRVAVVTELASSLHANPSWTMFEALADVDQRYLVPALSELRQGTADSVVLVANDTQLRIERRDRLKFWRRPKSAIGALLPVGTRTA
jgi:hypothetical protein